MSNDKENFYLFPLLLLRFGFGSASAFVKGPSNIDQVEIAVNCYFPTSLLLLMKV